MGSTNVLGRSSCNLGYNFQALVQGGSSARGKHFVDIYFKGPSQYIHSIPLVSSSDITSFSDIPSLGQVPNEHFVSKTFLIRLHS